MASLSNAVHTGLSSDTRRLQGSGNSRSVVLRRRSPNLSCWNVSQIPMSRRMRETVAICRS